MGVTGVGGLMSCLNGFGHCEARARRLWVEAVVGQSTGGTRTWRSTGPAGLRSPYTNMGPRLRCPHGRGAARRLQASRAHRCCETSKENPPSLRLAVTGTVSTC